MDTITQLTFNRKECSRLLIDLQSYFPTGLFHHPGLPVKSLPQPNPLRPKYKLEDVLIDTLFAQLFTLPRPPTREVYYAGVITEITKLAPGDVAPTLGRAIRSLYDTLDNLKGEVNMRFSSWFALHLSNFGFTYKWEEWYFSTRVNSFLRMEDLKVAGNSRKKVFLRETIDKEVRLSYLERIQRTLPEEYFQVFPVKIELNDWDLITRTSL